MKFTFDGEAEPKQKINAFVRGVIDLLNKLEDGALISTDRLVEDLGVKRNTLKQYATSEDLKPFRYKDKSWRVWWGSQKTIKAMRDVL